MNSTQEISETVALPSLYEKYHNYTYMCTVKIRCLLSFFESGKYCVSGWKKPRVHIAEAHVHLNTVPTIQFKNGSQPIRLPLQNHLHGPNGGMDVTQTSQISSVSNNQLQTGTWRERVGNMEANVFGRHPSWHCAKQTSRERHPGPWRDAHATTQHNKLINNSFT